METQIKNFVELCKNWRDFSLKTNGRKITYYINNTIRCYFTYDSDYTAVSIDGVDVSFHTPPKIQADINKLTAKNLNKIIEKYTFELENLKTQKKSINFKLWT